MHGDEVEEFYIYIFISFYFSFAAYVNFSHTNSLYIQFIGLEICGVEQGKEESKNSQNRWINLCTFFPLDFFSSSLDKLYVFPTFSTENR